MKKDKLTGVISIKELTAIKDIRGFLLKGGKKNFSIQNIDSGNILHYRIVKEQKADNKYWIYYVEFDENNQRKSTEFLGCYYSNKGFLHSERNSKIGKSEKCVEVITWFLNNHVLTSKELKTVKFILFKRDYENGNIFLNKDQVENLKGKLNLEPEPEENAVTIGTVSEQPIKDGLIKRVFKFFK